MSSRLLVVFVAALLLISLKAYATAFDLTWNQEDEFILAPTADKGKAVYVYLEGARDLTLDEVIDLTCEHGEYLVPVILSEVETGVSSATRVEYFIYARDNGVLRPVKSIIAIKSEDRNTGEALSKLVITRGDERRRQLCEYIPGDNDFDQPVWTVN